MLHAILSINQEWWTKLWEQIILVTKEGENHKVWLLLPIKKFQGLHAAVFSKSIQALSTYPNMMRRDKDT